MFCSRTACCSSRCAIVEIGQTIFLVWGWASVSSFFYYLLLSAGLVFGEAGVYPPLIGMWVPNIVTGAVGLYLLKRTVNDRPMQFESIGNTMRWIKSRFINK